MKIKELFKQEVDREIETVVKADDIRNIDTEIREYVITNEIDRKIGDLFSEYGNTSTINGVWIHGFFGSGKSHLLKILSYVFENKKLNNDITVAEIFASKTKDEIVKADIHRISKLPSESILFNIDQQATSELHDNNQSVLMVFYKVLYDHLGFYGSFPHIAEFEWWLHFRKNIYNEFTEKFHHYSGKEWTKARISFFDPELTEGIANSLKDILGRDKGDYYDILEEIEEKQNLSVEDFVYKVKEYLDSKNDKNFHLNFFIDEVGQFIAGDVRMMLNLQTITESLATVTKNRSWVFATAQSAIEGLGEDLKITQDYARILGRFKIQINLTSANVDEVIEKRLLEKKEDEITKLKSIYKKENALIETLISTTDSGMPIIAYKNEDDFVRKYPFFFYQFSLFQGCRTSLAEHDIFQGKHASVGERNMLGVFQSVLKEIKNEETPTVASFDKMYKGIENDLRAEFITSINNAQTNIKNDNEFTIKVLKTLFLVKYYKQFSATKENIAMLLIDDIHIDILKHQKRVKEALDSLEYHTYIERTGEIYEFLTNKEKDIETEIKKTEIDESNVNKLLKELFFDEIIGNNRIRYQNNKHEYSFTSKLDGATVGREHELSIEIISPNNADVENLEILKTQTMGIQVLRLVTKPNREFMDDVRMFLQIQRYNALNQSATINSEMRAILHHKLLDNNKRKTSLIIEADKMLGEAKAFINGIEIDAMPKTSGQTYVIECFQKLINVAYPNLRMLGKTTFTEEVFKQIVQGFKIPGLFDTGDASISEAENQIVTFIERRKKQNDRTSLYDLKNEFAKVPYGWYENATFAMLAKLYKKNKVEITIEENPLNDTELINALLNSSQHGHAFIIGQTEYSSQQIKAVKEVYRDLFDRSTTYNDAKDIGYDFKEKIKELTNEVEKLINLKNDFKFIENLYPFYEALKRWNNNPYNDYITEIDKIDNELVSHKIDHYDPIKAFINGQQAVTYRNIIKIITSNTPNISYIDGDEFENLIKFLEEPKPYIGDSLRIAEENRQKLIITIQDSIDKEKKVALDKYEKTLEDLKKHEEMLKLNKSDLKELLQPITESIARIKEEQIIANLQMEHVRLPIRIDEILNRAATINIQKQDIDKTKTQIKYINKRDIPIAFKKSELVTEADINEYIETLKLTLIKQIKDNRRIRL